MADDLKVEFRNVSDETRVERDGTTTAYKRYDFYIGKHGPFTERVRADAFTESEIATRVEKMRTHLRTLPT